MSEASTITIPFSDDELVLKNNHRIEQIDSRMETRVDVDILSWQIGRSVRRDFLLMTSKMYKIGCNKQNRMVIRELLLEIALQTAEMEAQSKMYVPEGEREIQTIPVRVVCAEAANLLSSLRLADKHYDALNWARHENKITERQRAEATGGFEKAYSDLKQFLFGSRRSNKTAGELAKEMGVA